VANEVPVCPRKNSDSEKKGTGRRLREEAPGVVQEEGSFSQGEGRSWREGRNLVVACIEGRSLLLPVEHDGGTARGHKQVVSSMAAESRRR